jgi:hypothetical protein
MSRNVYPGIVDPPFFDGHNIEASTIWILPFFQKRRDPGSWKWWCHKVLDWC